MKRELKINRVCFWVSLLIAIGSLILASKIEHDLRILFAVIFFFFGIAADRINEKISDLKTDIKNRSVFKTN
ncbi:MAG: hypothetical protein RI945_180 [Candidatus Parcubacteria bacterium]